MTLLSKLGGLCRIRNRCTEEGMRQSVHEKPEIDFEQTGDTVEQNSKFLKNTQFERF